MRAVDTNVLVRLLARDDVRQAAAADRFVAGGAWVSHLVLLEAVWVLSSVYGPDASRLGRAIEMLLEHSQLVLQDPEVVEAALVRYRSRRRVSFSDCLVLEVARKAGHVPMGTFDRALSRLEGAQRL